MQGRVSDRLWCVIAANLGSTKQVVFIAMHAGSAISEVALLTSAELAHVSGVTWCWLVRAGLGYDDPGDQSLLHGSLRL